MTGKKNFKIAVLASTNGTDLQAIIEEMQAGKMPGIELVCVLANKKCPALEKAEKHQIPNNFLSPKGYTPKQFDQELIKLLKPYQPDLIVLVGYMRILTSVFTKKYQGKIINVHPSLIPKYSGKRYYGTNVHAAVLAAEEKETGMTIHYVDEDLDTGDIILQKTCPVSHYDTVDTLKEKVQALEKEWYPEVIRRIARESRV